MEPSNDSYWTDRIVESVPEEQSLLKNQNEREEFLPIARGAPSVMPQETAEEHLDGNSDKDFCPVVLILLDCHFFAALDR